MTLLKKFRDASQSVFLALEITCTHIDWLVYVWLDLKLDVFKMTSFGATKYVLDMPKSVCKISSWISI